MAASEVLLDVDDNARRALGVDPNLVLDGPTLDRAAANLIKLRDLRVDPARTGLPALLAVILATGLSYVRPDGVAVIAIGALGP